MIDVDEALQRILSLCPDPGRDDVPVADAVGLATAEAIRSDVDSPPHNKSLVDGFAVLMDDARSGQELEVQEEIVAGAVPQHALRPGVTSHVMTGAPIPIGTEAMVMVEEVERVEAQRIRLTGGEVKANQFIMPRGTAFSCGQIVLHAGTVIRAPEVGLLCEVGRSRVPCLRRPNVAVLPTGDELVDCDAQPGPGQIRNSNGPMLHAAATSAGATVVSLGVGRDDQTELRQLIQKGLSADVLILSGGVSAGTRDLVPPTLAELGVQEVFHKVRVKPGKPVWFGIHRGHDRSCMVFGLPGNPVSSLVCFYLFVQPLLCKMAGRECDFVARPAKLIEPFHHRGNRPTYHPGQHRQVGQGCEAWPLSWHGSSDMRTLAEASCLIHFPSGDRQFGVDQPVEIFTL